MQLLPRHSSRVPILISIPQWCDCCLTNDFSLNDIATVFQSHNGAIAASTTPKSATSLLPVSIPQWCDCCQPTFTLASRLLNVSIPQWCDCCQGNSKAAPGTGGFQSHNGAIAAYADNRQGRSRTSVSIPQWCDCCTVPPSATTPFPISFNPTMVRLLHISVNWTPPDARTVSIPQWCDCCQPSSCNKPVRRRFQSHNGAIAAHRRGEGYAKALNGFNPTMVRLLHNLDRALMENLPVSIPQWCDCCLRYLLGGECDAKGFNPTMVRLLPMSSQQTQRFSSSFNPTMVRLLP